MAAFGGWRLTRAGILFVIGILVLGGLVTGGIFLVKNHGEAVRRDQAVKIAEQNLKDQSSSDTATTSTKDADTSDAKNTDKTNTGTNTSTGSTTNSGATTTTASAAPTQLPTTGPNTLTDLGNVLAVTILALSTAFYVSSRASSSKTNSRL